MPANRKRSRQQQFQPGNQTRTKWAARPAAAAAAAAGRCRGGDGEGVDSPVDFPYNLRDKKTWEPEPEIRIRQNASGSCGQKL